MPRARNTAPKPFCFVLMPFAKQFEDVYSLSIKAACTKAGAYCERVDEQIFEERIVDRIYNQIAKSDIIIADMSGRNPNVFYEVGYAHALGKLTVLLTNSAEDIPFDLKHYPHIIYSPSELARLKTELTRRIAYYVENPPALRTAVKPYFEVLINDVDIARVKSPIVCPLGENEADSTLTMHNYSFKVMEPNHFKIGFICPKGMALGEKWTTLKGFRIAAPVNLGKDHCLWVMTDFERLLPGESAVYPLPLWAESPHSDREYEVRVKVFLETGYTEYPITLIRQLGKHILARTRPL